MGEGYLKIPAQKVASVLGAHIIAGPMNVIFEGISTDSRNIKGGELFWALKGERFDGHDFVKKAVDSGALGAVVGKDQAKRFASLKATVLCVEDTLHALGDLAHWWRMRHSVLMGAVTGSVGKTTTKEMAACILSLRHETLKTEGNFNNLIGLPLTLFRLEERHGRAVVELGMNRPGEIARLTQIANPDAGVITEIGKAHLEGLGSLLGVARAKLEMAQEMKQEALLVINGDSAMLMNMAPRYGRDMFTFGMGEHNHIRAVDIRKDCSHGIGFTIAYGRERAAVNLKVAGRHNIMNALAAAGLCIGLKEDLGAVAKGLEQFDGLKGRFELVYLPSGVTLVDDTYNANPVSLKAALKGVENLVAKKGQLIIGLGDMLELGEEAEQAHFEAGQWVGSIGPKLFVAMGQYAEQMAEGARRGGLSSQAIMKVHSPEEMALAIEHRMQPGDVILLKASRKIELDKVREILEGRRGV